MAGVVVVIVDDFDDFDAFDDFGALLALGAFIDLVVVTGAVVAGAVVAGPEEPGPIVTVVVATGPEEPGPIVTVVVCSLLSGVLRLDSEVSTEAAADAVGTCSEMRAAPPSRKSAMKADRRLTTIMMELAGCVVVVIRSDKSQSERANE